MEAHQNLVQECRSGSNLSGEKSKVSVKLYKTCTTQKKTREGKDLSKQENDPGYKGVT